MSGKAGGGAAASGSGGAAAAGPANGSTSSGSGNSAQDHTAIILEYLSKRGYHGAAAALKAELDPSSSSSSAAAATAGTTSPSKKDAAPASAATSRTVSQEAFERRNLGATGAGGGGGGGRKPPGLREDPMPWRDGLLGLREFVLGSLDIHRPELLPILLPVYVHSYIDLVLLGYKDQAELIFNHFRTDYSASHPSMVHLLSMLKTPAQVQENERAIRWRKERYIVRMTRRGWSLLLGWLQGGVSGASGAGTLSGAIGVGAVASVNNEVMERGREKMLGIINERVKVDVIDIRQQQSMLQSKWSEGGLESELSIDILPLPRNKPDGSTQQIPVQSSSSTAPQVPLKLGPMPPDPKLDREVNRVLQSSGEPGQGASSIASGSAPSADVTTTDSNAAVGSISSLEGMAEPALTPLQPSDLPPYPPSFRTVDVRREVEKIREARKRIRLGPSDAVDNSLTTGIGSSSQAKWNLPSVCMFTMHDTGDTLISTEFSDDSSLLAAGFSESFIRLWNLKGEPLNGVRSDFEPHRIKSSNELSDIQLHDGPTTRKLVGHSGPVYSLSFDPLPGPSGPPRYLLSSSQDATVRLWNLQTYSNIVAYRGHRDPVWDVEWGPRGVYFATASRDRTARLWTTERIAAVRIFAGHLSDVETVRFHPNSLYLGTGSSDRTCRLWDVQKGMCLRVFVGHTGAVSTIAFSPDGRYLASAGDDKTVNLWDLGSSRLIKSMAGHTARIHSLSFSAESNVLVSGSSDCTVKVWDVKTSRKSALSTRGTGSANGVNGVAGGVGVGAVATPRDDPSSKQEDLLVSLPTKRTPIFTTKFTPRNLCLAAGPIF